LISLMSLLNKMLPTFLLRYYWPQNSIISKDCWDYALLEGECWNNKHGSVNFCFFLLL
jgi:hypothetical protein